MNQWKPRLSVEEGTVVGRLAYDEVVAERDRLREALEFIAGSFPPGDRRQTYGDPTETMDRIRDRAREALGDD